MDVRTVCLVYGGDLMAKYVDQQWILKRLFFDIDRMVVKNAPAINIIGLTENENKTEKPIDKQEEMRYNTTEDE